MSRPTITTPVETTVMVLRSMADWAGDYQADFEQMYGGDFSSPARATELADALEQAEETYVQEQREDVAVTNRRDQLVESTQRLVSSALALATIAFTDNPDLEDIKTDFAAGPPSNIRSPNTARKALTRLAAAVNMHEEAISAELVSFSSFVERIDKLSADFEGLSNHDAKETTETNTARRRRDVAREAAITHIRNLQLAAEAMEYAQPNAVVDLRSVFSTHNSSRRRIDDDVDSPSEPNVDIDSPAEPAVDPTPAPQPDPVVGE